MPKGKQAKPKKEGAMKYVATVMEVTHGGWFRSHKHYDVNVLEVPAYFKTSDVQDSAEKAVRVARKSLNLNVRVLAVQEVDITSRAEMKENAENFRSLIKK